ncbi:hypothetical protein [Anaerobutyricum hallii]|uniref:hypothetical protein n=1 Tax=Anaerobutyricum hallii TaxID=39488 RepID=UPI00399C7F5C
MSIMKKVALSNTQVFEVVGWYNNDFKKNKRNEVLPLKLQLDLQRNIGSLIEAAQSYEKVCKQLVMNVQKEYFTEEKTIGKKKIQKDENGEEKEVFEHILKDEYKEEYNEKINDINEKIQELGKEGEVYTLRVFDLDTFVDSNPPLTVDDLYMLTFMDENSEKIVEE